MSDVYFIYKIKHDTSDIGEILVICSGQDLKPFRSKHFYQLSSVRFIMVLWIVINVVI